MSYAFKHLREASGVPVRVKYKTSFTLPDLELCSRFIPSVLAVIVLIYYAIVADNLTDKIYGSVLLAVITYFMTKVAFHVLTFFSLGLLVLKFITLLLSKILTPIYPHNISKNSYP